MPISKVKKEYENTITAFKNSGNCTLPLGQNPYLDELAIIAHKSGNPVLKDMFQELPSLDQLTNASVNDKLEAISLQIKNENNGIQKASSDKTDTSATNKPTKPTQSK